MAVITSQKKVHMKKFQITEKEMKKFLISELGIPEDLYHRFIFLDQLAGMTDERHEQLLQKLEQHFQKKLPVPSRQQLFRTPSQIQNGFNQSSKLFRKKDVS
jgi:hypothetical protein